MGGPHGIDDRKCAVDIAINKESLARLGSALRRGPTSLTLADCLAKGKAEPADPLQSCVRHGTYQLADESSVLARSSAESALRKQFAAKHPPKRLQADGEDRGEELGE
eukprot:7517463-Pyramimonas_sp.AAC.1